MAFEHNFVTVRPSCLIDPVLKLRLQLGRWNPESLGRGGDQDVQLWYDPELRADRLTMPIPPKQRELLEMLGPLRQDWTVFESSRSRRIVDLLLVIHDDRAGVRLELAMQSLETTAILLAREGIAGLSERPWETLLYLLRATVLMPDWVRSYAIPWGKSSVALWAQAQVAAELSAQTGFKADRRSRGLARIAERPVPR